MKKNMKCIAEQSNQTKRHRIHFKISRKYKSLPFSLLLNRSYRANGAPYNQILYY